MDEQLAAAQALKYADELRELHEIDRAHRRGVEEALRRLEESYATTVRALAAAIELRDDSTGEHAERVTRLALRLAERVALDLVELPELVRVFERLGRRKLLRISAATRSSSTAFSSTTSASSGFPTPCS
jgi:HD-GYP domain-containing protein (c-di-GMP phosphodiesterase class II)